MLFFEIIKCNGCSKLCKTITNHKTILFLKKFQLKAKVGGVSEAFPIMFLYSNL
jgi:hypothetical protein